MNCKINLFVVSAGALFAITLFTACDSPQPKPPANFSASNLDGPQKNTGPSNAANNANQMVLRGPDGLPNLIKGEDYRRLRLKMIDSGWIPARSENGKENCVAGSEVCKEFPELEAGPAAGEGKAIFRWKRADKVVLIYGSGDPVGYTGHKFEKGIAAAAPPTAPASPKASATSVTGKYIYRSKHEYGEDQVAFELRTDNTAVYTSEQEGGDGPGLRKGKWSWNETTKEVTVTFGKDVYVFQLQGKDLKMTDEPALDEGAVGFSGTVFRKE